jgi:hypothetical protein
MKMIKAIFLFILLQSLCFGSEYYPIRTDGDFHALMCEIASDDHVKNLMKITMDEKASPSEYQLKKYFSNVKFKVEQDQFERHKSWETYKNNFIKTREAIRGKRKFSMFFKFRLGAYDHDRKDFQVFGTEMGRADGSNIGFNPKGYDKGKGTVNVYMDYRLNNRFPVPEKLSKRVWQTQTMDLYAPVKVYGTISEWKEHDLPRITVDKYKFFDPFKRELFGEVKTVGTATSVTSDLNPAKVRDNLYVIPHDQNRKKVILSYSGRNGVELFKSDFSIKISKDLKINTYYGESNTGGSTTKLNPITLGTGPQILKVHFPIFGKKRFLLAKLPDTPESYDLIESNDKKALEAAFNKYFKK